MTLTAAVRGLVHALKRSSVRTQRCTPSGNHGKTEVQSVSLPARAGADAAAGDRGATGPAGPGAHAAHLRAVRRQGLQGRAVHQAAAAGAQLAAALLTPSQVTGHWPRTSMFRASPPFPCRYRTCYLTVRRIQKVWALWVRFVQPNAPQAHSRYRTHRAHAADQVKSSTSHLLACTGAGAVAAAGAAGAAGDAVAGARARLAVLHGVGPLRRGGARCQAPWGWRQLRGGRRQLRDDARRARGGGAAAAACRAAVARPHGSVTKAAISRVLAMGLVGMAALHQRARHLLCSSSHRFGMMPGPHAAKDRLRMQLLQHASPPARPHSGMRICLAWSKCHCLQT